MKKKLLVLAAAVVMLLAIGGLSFVVGGNIFTEGVKADETENTETSAPAKNKKLSGLQKIDGKYYYYVKGEAVTDSYRKVNINGLNYYYYFQEDGSAFTGGYKKVTSKGNTYYCYFKKNGRAYADGLKKVKINDVNYYFYFNKSGRAVTNQLKKVVTSSGETAYYYFKSNGRAATNCFKEVDGKKYYFKENGQACGEGRHAVSHYLCVFDESGALVRRIDKNKKMIALTYDDGPSKNTATVLDVMEKYDTVCTFFIIGNQVSSYKSSVKRAAELGCELANHTYEHKWLDKLDTADEIRSQIDKCNQAVADASGVTPRLIRTPGGRHNKLVDETLGMPNIYWSIDTLDWKTRDTDATIKCVKEEAYDGAIVLMHDLHKPTTDACETIVSWLLEQGYQLVTVSEMAECRGIELEDGTLYSSMRPKK